MRIAPAWRKMKGEYNATRKNESSSLLEGHHGMSEEEGVEGHLMAAVSRALLFLQSVVDGVTRPVPERWTPMDPRKRKKADLRLVSWRSGQLLLITYTS
jgi:hypothetical protein